MTQLFANNAYGSLGASLTIGSTSITLGTGQGVRFPTPTGGDYFLLTLIGLDSNSNEVAWEIVKVTGRSTDTLTVTRAQESTAASVWASGTRVEMRATAGSFAAKQDLIAYTPENLANKNVANGYAGLDSSGLVPSSLLPSYVDDVLEYANFAALPAIGASGKIYVLATPYTSGGVTSSQFRWSGSAYSAIIASPGSTDAVAEGTGNLYFTTERARAAISVTQNLTYNSSTGVITGPDLSGYITTSGGTVTNLTVTKGASIHGLTVGRGGGEIISNCAFGSYPLLENTTGDGNTAIGNRALENNTTGFSHTAVGANALRVTTGAQRNNSAFGANSGVEITTGYANSIFGCFTGNQGGLDIITSNNYIVLSDGDGNPRAYWNSVGNAFFENTISFKSQYTHPTTTGSTTVELTNGQNQKLTLTGAATLDFTFPGVGHYQLWLVSGAHAVTWPTIGSSWQWLNATAAPTLNTGTYGGMLNIYWDGAMAVASYSKVGAV